jgi:predicted phosphate transport protein (TIGR00153 family)
LGNVIFVYTFKPEPPMLRRLIPRDEEFFDLFNQLSNHLSTTARMLNELFADPARVAEHVRKIKDVEHKADLLTTTVNQRIDKTFITPFDREDIHHLAARLDDVIDLLDGTSRRFEMLHIAEVKPPAKQLAGVLLRAADEIERAVKSMRKPAIVNQHVVAIKQLEEEGDAIYHEAVGALFAGTPNPLDVLKWKEMYDTLERAIDSCMGVAQVLQSISLKNA